MAILVDALGPKVFGDDIHTQKGKPGDQDAAI